MMVSELIRKLQKVEQISKDAGLENVNVVLYIEDQGCSINLKGVRFHSNMAMAKSRWAVRLVV